MKTTKPPRIAVIGCGAATERLHLPALSTLRLTPTLLVDPNLDRARTIAAKFKVPRVESEYRAALGEIDAAIVAAPHHLHAAVSSELLRRGIHVLVEKPLATTSAECAQVTTAAAESGAVLAVGLMRRFLSRLQWVKAAIDGGLVGTVQSFEIREGMVYRWPVTSASLFQKHTAGGGVLADTGAHTLDLVLWWFGQPKSFEYYDDSYGGVEADCTLQMKFDGGLSGHVELSRTRDLPNSAVIRGSDGQIEVRLDDAALDVLRADPPRLLEATVGSMRGDRLPVQRFRELFVLQITDWLQSIQSGKAPMMGGVEASRSVAFIEACYRRRQPLEFPWEPTMPREQGVCV
jgi:predicted dehydrogenase